MEDRIDILEREVGAIKSELAVIETTCWTREDARGHDGRLMRLEETMARLVEDVAQLKVDVAQLKIDVAQLKIDFAHMQTQIVALQRDVEQLKV